MTRLDGKWALVTGASRGIGKQIALGLADRGCRVIVHAREIGNLEPVLDVLREHGAPWFAVAGDLGTDEGVASVIRQVREEGPGPVDILYNNAAIQGQYKPIWDTTTDDWKTVFQANVWAPIALCQAFAPAMKERGWGRICNLSSGIRGVPQLAPYSASKAALDKYTIDFAAELKGSGVLVNGLDPGWLRTDMGGENAMFDVETVVPGALVPALIDAEGPTGHIYSAQDFRCLG